MLPSHSHHDQLVLDRLPKKNPKLLSIFIGRNPQDTFRDLDLTFEKSDLILVDREDSLRLLQELYPERMHHFYHLSSLTPDYDWDEAKLRKNPSYIINWILNRGLIIKLYFKSCPSSLKIKILK